MTGPRHSLLREGLDNTVCRNARLTLALVHNGEKKKMRIRAITVGIFVLVVPFVIAQTETITKQAEHEKEITPKQKAAKKRLDYMFESCAEFVGERTSDGAKIEILPKPLLRWTNPDFGVRDGLFVAWVDQKNRPMAAGQVFLMPNSENSWYIEQQSLSRISKNSDAISLLSTLGRCLGAPQPLDVISSSSPTL